MLSLTSRLLTTRVPTMAKTVLLYGLSAHPPANTGGHQGYVKYFTHQDWVDEMWVLPVYKHMYLEKQNLISFEHRFRMSQIAFEENRDVNAGNKAKVLDTEKVCIEQAIQDALLQGSDLSKVRVGTFQIVEYLKEKHPDTHFCFVMGGDTFNDLLDGKWTNTEELRAAVGIVHIPRIGYEVPAEALGTLLPPPVGTATSVDIPSMTDVSSTKIRNLAAKGDYEGVEKLVDPRVAEYMRENKLYGLNSGTETKEKSIDKRTTAESQTRNNGKSEAKEATDGTRWSKRIKRDSQ
ncbi:hypothetical protein SARC_04949 [Sphaeroforma arctica JP610]|uniref:Cytidyltransferase-like domain-containing protein n=1 Tax=Sphaeroforma arctica JP610 TaxID=667725 RepID=A0A0L0G3J6_9EUKA|nr:hypothetical protein SARC_04949 [Sphaeroforma arctica JP610]KNC82773.1 hypothetical protein SARC_04949 [Sphaeroforma arctica JP610]|eukprot:XP_014156675.1 hypothetical protein SARC_04949 [Sphaeroforma arctica JP610]